jgi:hypothetical protein
VCEFYLTTANLPSIHGVATKWRRVSGNLCNTIDCFEDSQVRIEKIKMETAIQLHANNKKVELDILHS